MGMLMNQLPLRKSMSLVCPHQRRMKETKIKNILLKTLWTSIKIENMINKRKTLVICSLKKIEYKFCKIYKDCIIVSLNVKIWQRCPPVAYQISNLNVKARGLTNITYISKGKSWTHTSMPNHSYFRHLLN